MASVPSTLPILSYSLAFVAAAAALYHANRHMPKSWYSTGLQTAFALTLVLASALCAVSYIYLSGNFIECLSPIIFIYDMAFIFHFATYFFAQTEFLRSFMPVSELRVNRIIFATRTLIILTAALAIACVIGFNIQQENTVLATIFLWCLTIGGLFDVGVNGYMVMYSLGRFKDVGWRLRAALVTTWAISLVDYATSMTLITVIRTGPSWYKIVGKLLANVYVPLSYMCIIIIRRMLIASADRLQSKVEHGKIADCKGASMSGVGLVQPTSVTSMVISVDMPPVPPNSIITNLSQQTSEESR